jgi:aspartate ammonia-lyase
MDTVERDKFLALVPTLPVDKMVKLFVKVREAKAKATKAAGVIEANYKAVMEACENHMLAAADKAGVEGFRTEFGTTYTAETSKVSIADDQAFFAFVKEKGDLDFFERRVSSTHVANYAAANEGALPPGLNVFRERVMRVRKAGEK